MKILIAEDDAVSRLVLGATLRKLGHAVTSAQDGDEALRAWRREQPDLLISDWMMPGLDGLELCRHIRTEPALQYTYIILLTSLGGKGRYLLGMEAGADDFVSKPFDEEYLAARLHVAERILSLHQLLRREATHDRLTGLWNRAAILDHLRHELAHPVQDGALAVIMADLDYFKAVNDTHGHAAGDRVLQETALRIQACLGPCDRVGRYGGEEFLIVVPGGSASSAAAIAEAVRGAVGGSPIATAAAQLTVTTSLGLSLAPPGTQATAGTLLAAADRALYAAKAGGRNRTEVAPEQSETEPEPDLAAGARS